MPLALGDRLAERYRLVETLGSGGMASVFLAEDERARVKRVLKQLHFDEPEMLAAFRREFALLSRLTHPNLIRVHDFGTNSESAVDYPDFAHAVARAVSDGSAEVGIVIDGAGVGSAMTANKGPGVRAAACYSVEVARNSREHNGANLLTLGSKTITNDQMRDIVRAWLSTDLTEERHRKRVGKIDAIERQYQR